MIKYLGSKRLIVDRIVRAVNAIPGTRSVLDLFSGTARVGHALKRAGYRVLANDHNEYARVLATCYVAADREKVLAPATRLVREFNRLRGKPGWFTETFCVNSRFFQPKNGARVDAIRDAIRGKGLEPELEAVLLTSLMEAADRVDSTTGVQMAYLKRWAPRALGDLELRVPDFLPRARAGKGEAHGLDAFEAAARLEADVAYLDPPYNQHSYLGNYHVWESLARWDRPEVYGIARKRLDVRSRQSVFNSRPRFRAAFSRLVRAVRARTLIVSFSDEGYLDRAAMEEVLGLRPAVGVVAMDFKRYVGAQIGIYNPQGVKVGKAGRLRNREFLFIAGARRVVDRAMAALS
ncbi:MAG: DNA adenine methylase [Candidatus Coatesbacteria bacterium]